MMRAFFSANAYLEKMPRVIAIFAVDTVFNRERVACDGTKGANFVWCIKEGDDCCEGVQVNVNKDD